MTTPPTVARRPYTARRQKPQYDAGSMYQELMNVQQAIPVARVRTALADDSVQATDDAIAADATAGAVTITLPPANQLTYLRVTIYRQDATTNAVTISGSFAVGSSVSLGFAGDFVVLQSDGVVWHIVGRAFPAAWAVQPGEVGVVLPYYPPFDLQRYGASPSASAATNRAAIQNALDSAHALGGGIVTASVLGFYQIDDTLVWPSGVGADFGWGAAIDGATEYYGAWLSWYGATNKPMISLFDKEYVHIEGLGLDGRLIARSCFLIDSDNAPAAHNFVIERCALWNAERWIEWGTSGATARQSDQVNYRHCDFYNATVVGIPINSQNASQESLFENCHFLMPLANAIHMFEAIFSPYQIEINRCTFGAVAGWTGACFRLETGATSGGQNLILKNNGIELGGSGYLLSVPVGANERNGGMISLEDNSISGAKIQVDADRYISSKRNQYLTSNPTFTSASRILSEQDVFTSGAWTLSGGAQVITLDRLTLAMVLKSLTVTDLTSTGTIATPFAAGVSGPFALDVSGGSAGPGVAIANNGTLDIQHFSGPFTVNETTATGIVGTFLAAASAVLAGPADSGFSVISGNAGTINVFRPVGSTVRIENKTGVTVTVTVMMFRTRAA